jgi:hypothetical protein
MVVNAAQLATYSQAKQFLLDTGQIVVLIAFTVNELTNIFFFRVIENRHPTLIHSKAQCWDHRPELSTSYLT